MNPEDEYNPEHIDCAMDTLYNDFCDEYEGSTKGSEAEQAFIMYVNAREGFTHEQVKKWEKSYFTEDKWPGT